MSGHFITTAAMVLMGALQCFSGARIHWLETQYDFGAFNEDLGKATATFRYVNTGDEPLVITGARANCGCTTPRYQVEPVAPGDTAQITVAYDASGRPGRFSKKVFVDTNTNPQRSTLTVKGVVIGAEASVSGRYPVEMGSLRLSRPSALLGNAAKGHAKSVFLNAYNRSTDTLSVSVAGAPKWLDVTVTPQLAPPGEQVALGFLVRPDRSPLYGVVTDTVTVMPDKRHPEQTYRLPVIVTMTEDFSGLSDAQLRKAPAATLSTDRINLGDIPADRATTTSFTISNTGKSALELRRIYSTDAGIGISVKKKSIKPGKSAEVSVTVKPTPGTELINTRITVITNDPITPVQVIRLTATPVI